MSRNDTAHALFEACETGKGWDVCQNWCKIDATFSCQADALADTVTLEAYSEWMKGLLTPVPDGRYVLKAFAMVLANRIVYNACRLELQGESIRT